MVMLSTSTLNCSASKAASFSKIMFIYSCRFRRPDGFIAL